MNFSSDTAAPAHPDVFQAMMEANTGAAPSYGNDVWTERAREALCRVFECDLDIWLVASGTAANALGLATLCPPHGSIFCHAEAHIERDERGAPEFFTGGGKLALLPGLHGRIDLAALRKAVAFNRHDFVHETPAHVLSLSNLTECGAAYRPFEIAERAAIAHEGGLAVHLDGARFANALVSTGATPAEMSWRAGVDVMSFGATKNGVLGCEAIILFGSARQRLADLRVRAKRAGHMPPKMRFLAAQMCAYLRDGLWLSLARQANASAQGLAEVLLAKGGELVHPVDGNEIFARLPEAVTSRLRAAGASFYDWPDGSNRFVCSWNTPPEEIAAAASVLT
ncbi:MAG: threonine aldolase [Rhodobacterales bacterium 12-64-8]|nr:MAG: threonine aldolase [Rhodobacterales bacterium 12-64-8]OYX46732.1 MAG: threonine aldolase [Alphaproteobacteria bacterium 32-64-14]